MRHRILLGLVGVGVAVTAAAAEPTWTLSANDSTYSYVCAGDDRISLRGNDNSLTVTGECAVLDVRGSGNRITIESVGTIRLDGNNNDVLYERTAKGKRKPVLKIKGSANSVHRD